MLTVRLAETPEELHWLNDDKRAFKSNPSQKTQAKLIGRVNRTNCVITIEAPGAFDEACGKALEELLLRFG